MLLTEIHQRLAGVQIPLAPGRDHLNIRIQRVSPKLEAHLIIALARGAMSHRRGTGFPRNFHHTPSNQRPSDTGAKQVFAFVHRIGTKHGVNIVGDEVFGEVFDVDFLHTHGLSLLAGRFHLFALANIGGKRHHLGVICLLQPTADDRGIQPAGIGEDDFVFVRHEFSFIQSESKAGGILGQGGSGGKFHSLRRQKCEVRPAS